MSQRGDVIDHIGAAIERGTRDIAFHRVDRNRHVALRADAFNDWKDAPDLFRRRYRDGAGSCRFAADVDDGRAVFRHLQRALDGLTGIEMHAGVGKRIGRDVDDGHDERNSPEGECAGAGEKEG